MRSNMYFPCCFLSFFNYNILVFFLLIVSCQNTGRIGHISVLFGGLIKVGCLLLSKV